MLPLSIIWDFDPTFIKIGDLEIRYYGLMWVAAFLLGSWLFGKIVKREHKDQKLAESVFMYGIIATAIGARVGHCLFYEPTYYLEHPLEIITGIRNGGLASHGAAIGMLIGFWLFSRKYKVPFLWTMDRVTMPVAIGGALIRVGNLMNSEVYGTATDAPWGFIFVRVGETTAMHPTQIYEALAYTIIFAILAYMYFRRDAGNQKGLMFGVFMILLFASRFIIESIKQPQESFEADMLLNMGQWLSIPFIAAGVVMVILSYKYKAKWNK